MGQTRSTQFNAKPLLFKRCLPFFLFLLLPLDIQAEPRIILGPTEPGEAPESIETLSGLSYDQLRKLKELKQWIEDRQMARDRKKLDEATRSSPHETGNLFNDRELLAPLGNRTTPLESGIWPRSNASSLNLNPLTAWERGDNSNEDVSEEISPMPQGRSKQASRKLKKFSGPRSKTSSITHIYLPAASGEGPELEYEINPVRP
jgi:hypothetical protein